MRVRGKVLISIFLSKCHFKMKILFIFILCSWVSIAACEEDNRTQFTVPDFVFVVGDEVNYTIVNEGGGGILYCAHGDLPEGLGVYVSYDLSTCILAGTVLSPMLPTKTWIDGINEHGWQNISYGNFIVEAFEFTTETPLFGRYRRKTKSYTATAQLIKLLEASFQFTNLGGPNVLSCEVLSGTLPAGIDIIPTVDRKTCRIEGVPLIDSDFEIFQFAMTVTNNIGTSPLTHISLTVQQVKPQLVSAETQFTIYTDEPFTYVFENVGGVLLSYCESKRTLPEGLEVLVTQDRTSCMITGEPRSVTTLRSYSIQGDNGARGRESVGRIGIEVIRDVARLKVDFTRARTIIASWNVVASAHHYNYYVSLDSHNFNLGQVLDSSVGEYSQVVHLPDYLHSAFRLETCFDADNMECLSSEFTMSGNLVDAIGILSPSLDSYGSSRNRFGAHTVVSSDGSTIIVGDETDDSAGRGVFNVPDSPVVVNDEQYFNSGAVFVYRESRTDYGAWDLKAIFKPRESADSRNFGDGVQVNSDGTVIVVASAERCYGNRICRKAEIYDLVANQWQLTQVIDGDGGLELSDRYVDFPSIEVSDDGLQVVVGFQNSEDDLESDGVSGAIIKVYARSNLGEPLEEREVIDMTNSEGIARPRGIALSSDKKRMAICFSGDFSGTTGVNSFPISGIFDPSDRSRSYAYVFDWDENNQRWNIHSKFSSHTSTVIHYCSSISLSPDGQTLAIGAPHERSDSEGVGAEQLGQNQLNNIGAVYVYRFDEARDRWAEEVFIKSVMVDTYLPFFGQSLALSGDGNKLVVGGHYDRGAQHGVTESFDRNLLDLLGNHPPGALFVYEREGATWIHTFYLKPPRTSPNYLAPQHMGASCGISYEGKLIVGGATGGSNDGSVVLF